MTTNKVAVVTGANKGLGFGTVKELCRRGVNIVYLTARDKGRGEKAVKDLEKDGYKPLFYQLDVCDKHSVNAFAEHLKEKHDGLDILINNAGILPTELLKTTYEESKRVIDTNYYSVLFMQEYIFPVLKDNARVINISSNAGHISNLRNQYWIEKLTKEDIDVGDINAFISWFLESIANASLKAEDFVELAGAAYKVSKIALCALTRVQQNTIGRGISINSLHPGYVKTDMTMGAGHFTVEEASLTPVYLALDADQSLKGKYIWFDKSEKEWTDIRLHLYPTVEGYAKILKDVGCNKIKQFSTLI